MSAEIDINDLSLQDEVVEVDKVSGEDFLGFKLPDDKRYPASFAFGQDKIKVGTRGDGSHFLNVHIAASLQDEYGRPAGVVFDRLNSVVYENREGKKSSRLHATLDILGTEVPPGTKLPELYSLVEQTFAASPSGEVETQWQASAKAESEEEVEKAVAAGYAKKDKLKVGNYYTFLKGQRKFPPKESGGFSPRVLNPITGVEVEAQVVIRNYYARSKRAGA